MRRDVGFYVEANVEQVYQACLQAAMNKPFERECKQEPFHTISFGLNFSFKYNMNGGACTIHFMPSGSGTAVNMRFSVVQAVGARYEKYAQDLSNAMRVYLPVPIHPANYDMEAFVKPENQVLPTTCQNSAAPVSQVMTPDVRYCVSCGSALAPGSRFCSQCGAQLSVPIPKVCPMCNTPAENNAKFCAACGAHL